MRNHRCARCCSFTERICPAVDTTSSCPRAPSPPQTLAPFRLGTLPPRGVYQEVGACVRSVGKTAQTIGNVLFFARHLSSAPVHARRTRWEVTRPDGHTSILRFCPQDRDHPILVPPSATRCSLPLLVSACLYAWRPIIRPRRNANSRRIYRSIWSPAVPGGKKHHSRLH
ncbi:hypothetical protein BDP81DRAFT_412922 [Colletotrichum phormii]|uniref:Uncharacterized protein n=1 Tax=Colletotrichum phormii TaxID=359342 RepID=A0AAJ0A5V3_9PEZI|nr:uncharacterized protein BDP81DRAFT_412922 [Colletotrichum phormii]KAK1655567.1 hypothetical protein BDP81DRAFT_412922 [Colletotrichum phormii]